MKKHIKLIAVIVLSVILLAFLCSCGAPNTVSTDTKYKLALATQLFPDAEGAELSKTAEFALGTDTVSGCAWTALKEYRKSTYDSTTSDTVAAIKYYTPAEAKGTDTVSYTAAFTAAAKKQLELAAAGGAEIIVITDDDYTNAYLEIKDTTKTFGEIAFVLLTVPGSRVSNAAALNAKTTAVILDNEQFGYLFGYYAVQNGYKKVGYCGADNNASTAFISGLKAGVEAAGEGEVLTSLTSSGPVENIIKEDIAKISDKADILIGDQLTMSFIKTSGKKYASIYKDEKAEFYITINSEVLTAKFTEIINAARQANAGSVKRLSAADNIFVYSKESELVSIPELSLSKADATAADTASETN